MSAKGGSVVKHLGRHAVPILFLALCLFGIVAAKITPTFLLGEMSIRVGRNSVLVLSLLIPILAGLGLNFGIVIGAMAGQIAAILAVHWGFHGISGFGAMLKHYDAHAPLGRSCEPSELGATGVFLASDGAAAITGQVIYVDGGYQIMGM